MKARFLMPSLLALPLVTSTTAEAAIPIPCTGSRFLQAAELSNITDQSGRPIVPYYNVFGCSDGKWDGYKTADGKYMRLETLPASKLPAAPTFWTAALHHPSRFWVEWLWMVVGTFVIVGTVLASLAGPPHQAPSPGRRNLPRRN